MPKAKKRKDTGFEASQTKSVFLYRKRRKTPCFSYGDIRRSETKFLLKG